MINFPLHNEFSVVNLLLSKQITDFLIWSVFIKGDVLMDDGSKTANPGCSKKILFFIWI